MLCVVLVLISVLAFYACGKDEPKTYAPATDMDLNTIYADYHDNEFNAKETHIGQRYKITAMATDITETSVTVTQDIIYPYTVGSFRVDLSFDKDQIEFIKTFSRGDTVTFEGTLTDVYNGNFIDFDDVVFISKTD